MLALTHVAAYFFLQDYLPRVMSDKLTQFCWPGLTFCHWTPKISVFGWNLFLAAYLALAASTVVAFLFPVRRPVAFWLTCALMSYKIGLMSLSYLTMGNYHYIPLLLGAGFLFCPQKQKVYLCGLVAVYFFAGALKLNSEWLSGAALGRLPPSINLAVFQWMLAYVIVLEMVFIFGVISERKILRALVLFQILIFHVFSISYVGWFYPTVMGLLWLAGVVLILEDPQVFRRNLAWGSKIAVVIFCLMQLPPHIYGERSALDGRLRLASLSMFDARSQCLASLLLKRGNTWMDLDTHFGKFGIRVKCDPIMFESLARSICRADEPTFDTKIGLFLQAKTTTSQRSYQILNKPNFCVARLGEP